MTKVIRNKEIKEWLLKEVFPFNSLEKEESINLIVKNSQFIAVRPEMYLTSFKSEEVVFDLEQVIFTRNRYGVKFKNFCYYDTKKENDINFIFCIDSDKENIFTVDITDELITNISSYFNIIDTLNESCRKTKGDYFYIDSLIVDISNENIFINFIDSKDQYNIRHAYNELEFFNIMKEEKPNFYRMFSTLAFN